MTSLPSDPQLSAVTGVAQPRLQGVRRCPRSLPILRHNFLRRLDTDRRDLPAHGAVGPLLTYYSYDQLTMI